MSISSITEDELLRKGKRVPSASRDVNMNAEFKKAVDTPISEKDSTKGSIDALTKYIPTETLTLYIATVSALPAIDNLFQEPIDGFYLYMILIGIFSLLTIVFVILIYAGKYNKTHKDIWWPPKSSEIPVWSLISATLAFIVWAVAIPNSLYELSSSWGVIASLLALFTSISLPRLQEAFFPDREP
jgi:hypothetical protein